MIAPALADTIAATQRALRAAGVNPIDVRTILLTGGSSRIPLVRQMISAELHVPATVDPHPAAQRGDRRRAGDRGGLGNRADWAAAGPMPGSPVAGPPVSGPPVSGMPASGPPVSGMPASGPPASPARRSPSRPVPGRRSRCRRRIRRPTTCRPRRSTSRTGHAGAPPLGGRTRRSVRAARTAARARSRRGRRTPETSRPRSPADRRRSGLLPAQPAPGGRPLRGPAGRRHRGRRRTGLPGRPGHSSRGRVHRLADPFPVTVPQRLRGRVRRGQFDGDAVDTSWEKVQPRRRWLRRRRRRGRTDREERLGHLRHAGAAARSCERRCCCASRVGTSPSRPT